MNTTEYGDDMWLQAWRDITALKWDTGLKGAQLHAAVVAGRAGGPAGTFIVTGHDSLGRRFRNEYAGLTAAIGDAEARYGAERIWHLIGDGTRKLVARTT